MALLTDEQQAIVEIAAMAAIVAVASMAVSVTATILTCACATEDMSPVLDEDLPPFTTVGVSTLAGGQVPGTDDGYGPNAKFNNPVNLIIIDHYIYVADYDNGRLRKVNPRTREVTTVKTPRNFHRPFGLAKAASEGAFYVQTDQNPSGDLGEDMETGTIWYVDTATSQISPVVRDVGRPRGMLYLDTGDLILTDPAHHTVSRLGPYDAAPVPIAGTPDVSGYQDGPTDAALFNQPYSPVRLDRDTILIADHGNNCVRALNLVTRQVTTWLTELDAPKALAVGLDGQIYISDTGNHVIREVDQNQELFTIAGDFTQGYLDSTNPHTAKFAGMEGILVSTDGIFLYVADGTKGEDLPFHSIRQIELSTTRWSRRLALGGIR